MPDALTMARNLLLVILALVVLLAWLRTRVRKREARRTAPDAQRERLVNAADWAIAMARARSGPNLPGLVTTEEVQRRAAEDYGLGGVSREQVAVVLLERMTLRDNADRVVTDADVELPLGWHETQ